MGLWAGREALGRPWKRGALGEMWSRGAVEATSEGVEASKRLEKVRNGLDVSTHLIKRVKNFDPNPLYFVSGSCRVIVSCQFLPALNLAD